ncbi:MAG: biotin/lipoyl-binding protein [Holophagales bacterium]|nr:biotin/lipoyl-binding protein [Holophagales bacterium]
MSSAERATPLAKVLVANRGEIARRIFRTLREMGIPTVAVFSDADAAAPHVQEADEAVRIGPPPSAESYLDHDAVIAAARATGAEAIHPGYGFLAENAEFAERCAREGLVFVGPPPDAIRTMGDKAAAKALATRVGVPVLDGFALSELEGEELGASAVAERAAELGYPLLVKAAAGGGGKGMRAVVEASELESALEAAAREAEAAFGDGALLLERYLQGPRHVEVQILADAHGNVVHLFERDCSVQRRHQKVFEEAPSPAVDAELRARMGEAAVALARAVGYAGAGTVEFLLDDARHFYFLEMNTRLQVEHPVTEAITGLDLVRLQIEVAQGAPLPFTQDQLRIDGHALEARLYAEDASRDFLPATGTVTLWQVPEMPGLRVDSGVEAGSEVGVHYDPMLAKVIARGRDRTEAVRRLHRGLEELAVGGLTTNRDFLLRALEHEVFRDGDLDTSFVERHLPGARRSRPIEADALELHAVAATLFLFDQRRRAGGPVPATIPPGWRNNPWRAQEQAFELHGDGSGGRLTVRYVALGGDRFRVDVERGDPTDHHHPTPAPERSARWSGTADGVSTLELDGVRRRFRLASGVSGDRLTVHGQGHVTELGVVPRFPDLAAATVAGACAAPMTGKVIQVLVAEGDRVEAGTPLLILEAMKMEHRLEAQTEGVVTAVRVAEGQMVDPDEVLVVVSDPDGEEAVAS